MIKNVEAVFFDLDGTLVDSKLNFELIRKDLGFPTNVPILEYLETITDSNESSHAKKIIIEYEMHGANIATLFEGVEDYLELLRIHSIPTGILTRNCKIATERTLSKFDLKIESVLTRECFPAKPNPEALLFLAEKYSVNPSNTIYIGDFKFDIDTAINAGMISGLKINEKNTHLISSADFSFKSFKELPRLIEFNKG
jgi:HAD superfamily hydrolase (TIGR01509 family)